MMLCIRRSRKLASTRIRLFPKRLAYLRSQCILSMSMVQFILGLGFIILQVLLLQVFPIQVHGNLSLHANFNAYAPGIWIAGVQMIGAGLTILVAVEPVYFWVHISMAFNIIGVLGNFLASLYILCFELPALAIVFTKLQAVEPTSNSFRTIQIIFGCTIIMGICSVLSLCIGSFLASATGFPIFCGFTKSSKCSPRSSLGSGTRMCGAMYVPQLQSPPMSKKAFNPTNVAANLNFKGEPLSPTMETVPF